LLDKLVAGVAPHPISSMCTVFAESEVISLRSAGVAPESILSGIVYAMARRSANFIGRLGVRPTILFTGGVSHCDAFRQHLSEALGTEVKTHPDAQFAGALGAALVGGRQKKRGMHGG
jgi:predicted CoA-substrate-specific enzyme activase